MKFNKRILNLIFLLSLTLSKVSYTQQSSVSQFEYISPVPGSIMNMPETNIIIRYGPAFSTENIYSEKAIEVMGDKSGLHTGKVILAENSKTLIFVSDIPYQNGEVAEVKLLNSIKTEQGQVIPELIFSFKITESKINQIGKTHTEKYLLNKISEISEENKTSVSPTSKNFQFSVMDDSLPEDFPNIEILSTENPAEGLIFLTPFDYFNQGENYLVIMDNYGIPVFYRKMHFLNYDFKKQPTGVLTFYDELAMKFFVLDDSYNLIDSLFTKNGYVTDVHELIITENNH